MKLYHEACLKRNNVELPRYKKNFMCPFCKLQALVTPAPSSNGDPSQNMNNLCADNDNLTIVENEDDSNNSSRIECC